MNYTLRNTYGTISVSDKFVNSCKVFTNLFEDTENCDNLEPLTITDSYDINDVKQLANFYDELDALSVELDNGDNISYLEYITTHQQEFIQTYTNMRRKPPHCKKVMEIYQCYGSAKLQEFIQLDSFFNNQKLIRGIMLCIVVFIYVDDKGQADEIMKTLMRVVEDQYI